MDDDQDNLKDNDDEDDQSVISSIFKRKRVTETGSGSSPPSKKQKVTDTRQKIVISEVSPLILPDIQITQPVTETTTLPIIQTTQTLTVTTTSTEPTTTMTLSSDSEEEREVLKKIAADIEQKEEEERKRKLLEQNKADRALIFKLSSEEASERERLLKEKEDQEKSDAEMAIQLAKELEAKCEKVPEKRKIVKTPADKRLDEIDRKRYAPRMTGRSNPEPITKVQLKKPRNQSRAQLLIFRDSGTQSVDLDQICKMHREEWNEIRLAVSHSTSAAKEEVLAEIDRLYQKMVSLGLLKPNESVQTKRQRVRSTSSISSIPESSKLNLSIPDGVPRIEGYEVTEGDKGLVIKDKDGYLKFIREAELDKASHEQLVHLIRLVSMLSQESLIKKAILDEALSRHLRFLPSKEKYELAEELGMVKEEEIWRDK